MSTEILRAGDREPPVGWSGVDYEDLSWVRRESGWHLTDCPADCDDCDRWGEDSSIAYPIVHLPAPTDL
jgi:hypothetical protein